MIRTMMAGLAATSLLVSASALAQNVANQPGARPPVMPANSAPALHPIGVPGMAPPAGGQAPASVTGAAPATFGGGSAPTPSARIDSAPVHRSNRPKGQVQPPPTQVMLQSGVNATMGIAFDYTNRFVTPFEHPVVKTNSTASISVEESIVYVSTNADDPISLFIHDRNHGDPAISLTLIPEEMPAVSTQIRINGVEPDAGSQGWGGRSSIANPRPASSQLAHSFETSSSYVETVLAVMKELAHGRVPEGYSFTALRGYSPLMPACSMPGLEIQPAQLLGGSAFSVIVARASNVGVAPVQVKEDGCTGDRVRAVAAWPDRILRPGMSTEVYILLSRSEQEDGGGDQNVRPAVAGVR